MRIIKIIDYFKITCFFKTWFNMPFLNEWLPLIFNGLPNLFTRGSWPKRIVIFLVVEYYYLWFPKIKFINDSNHFAKGQVIWFLLYNFCSFIKPRPTKLCLNSSVGFRRWDKRTARNMKMLVLTVGILKRLYLIYFWKQRIQLALLPALFFVFHTNTFFVNFWFIIPFYRKFRLCITALQATRASGKAHTPL